MAAKKTTYTCPEVPGSKRSSHRAYTHAVVGRYDCAKARAALSSKAWLDVDRANYGYAKQQAVGVGAPWSSYNHATTAEEHAKAVELVAQFATEEAYVQHQRALRVKRINDEHGQGDVGQVVVLQWSMSAANAAKGCSQWKHWLDVRVVECVPADAVAA